MRDTCYTVCSRCGAIIAGDAATAIAVGTYQHPATYDPHGPIVGLRNHWTYRHGGVPQAKERP